MGLFNRPKKRYVSNATPEQMDFFEQLDRTVAIAVKDGSPLIGGALHLCVTQEGYDRAAAVLGLTGESSGPYQAALGIVEVLEQRPVTYAVNKLSDSFEENQNITAVMDFFRHEFNYQ